MNKELESWLVSVHRSNYYGAQLSDAESENISRCSCGHRPKHKCAKESDSGSGKICLKAED